MVVGVHVGADVVRTDHLGDTDQLVIIIATFEEGFLGEHHTSEHAACRPDIELVVIIVIAEEELRRFEVARRDPTIEALAREVKVRETPVCNHS